LRHLPLAASGPKGRAGEKGAGGSTRLGFLRRLSDVA